MYPYFISIYIMLPKLLGNGESVKMWEVGKGKSVRLEKKVRDLAVKRCEIGQ